MEIRTEHIIQTIVAAVLVAMLVWMLQGCKIQDCVPETIIKDSIRVEFKHDSTYIYEKDSVFIKEKADTVFVEKWKTHYKDVLKIERDTVWQENKVVEVKEVLVEKPIAGVVKWFAWIGAFAVVWVLVKFGLCVYSKFFLKV